MLNETNDVVSMDEMIAQGMVSVLPNPSKKKRPYNRHPNVSKTKDTVKETVTGVDKEAVKRTGTGRKRKDVENKGWVRVERLCERIQRRADEVV